MSTLGNTITALLSSCVVGGMVQSCTAAQKQEAAAVAAATAPYLSTGCRLAEEVGLVIDPSATGVIVLVCDTAEAADAAVAALTPRMVQVRKERVWSGDNDGGVMSYWRLRCQLPAVTESQDGGSHG